VLEGVARVAVLNDETFLVARFQNGLSISPGTGDCFGIFTSSFRCACGPRPRKVPRHFFAKLDDSLNWQRLSVVIEPSSGVLP